MNKQNKTKTKTETAKIVAQTPAPHPYTNHRGRFITLHTRSKRGQQKFCAKILSISNNYVTFINVNNGEVLKVAKTSII
jgi:hypothetical protein